MTLADRIANILSSHAIQDNVLTDGRITCRYADIPALLETIGRYLHAQGVNAEDCLAVECINSVPGALVLIYLLRHGYGFMLLPPATQQHQSAQLKPIPQFCRYRLVINPLRKDQEHIWEQQPEQFLTLETRDKIAGQFQAPLALDTTAKIFLRTSGSMGMAKIVVHSHANILGNAENCVHKYQFTPEDRVVIPVPIFHMYGFGAEFLPALLVGASMDLQAHSNLLRYLDRERRFQPTIGFVTPNLVEMLLQGRKQPRPYKILVTSGQRIREDVFRAFDPLCGNTLVNQYGSTEMGATAACDPGADIDTKATTIGLPMHGVTLRIEYSGEAKFGQLYCQHPYGYLGYVDDYGAWLSTASPWYATGDIANVDTQGNILVLGRADNGINRSGYLVLLSDIETAMAKLEPIAQIAMVATAAHNIQGQKIIACCVLKAGITATGTEIRTASTSLLPKYAVPDGVILLDSLPLLPSGKVDQQALITAAISGAI